MKPRFNYGKIFLLGFGFFGVSVIWGVYNAFVPIFLAEKFNLQPALIGFFMTLDNIAALFIQPPVGAWSDRLRTPVGRRMPFILIGAPITALAFGLIPLAAVLPLFVACTSTLLLSAALWRTPVIALMPDITPSEHRSPANGIINFMGGIGTIIALQTGGLLYKLNPSFPFWMGSGLVVLAALLVLLLIREPKEFNTDSLPERPFAGFGKYLLSQWPWFLSSYFLLGFVYIWVQEPAILLAGFFLVFVLFYALFMAREPIHNPDKSSIQLLSAIFFWFLGFSAVETFFTLYAKNHLSINEADGATLLSVLPLFFVLFAIPSGWIAKRIGRRRTISAGLMLIIIMLILLYVTPASILLSPLAPLPLVGIPVEAGGPSMLTVAGLLLILGGVSWALVNVNSLPMVVDMVEDTRVGAYTGLYYLFSTLSAIVGPNVNGWAIQLSRNNYNIIMLLAPIFMLFALMLMLGVKRGEARSI